MSESPVVILTGASQGIGAEVARWLGKTGAAVTLIARSESGLHQVAKDVTALGGNSLIFSADVAGRDACIMAVQETVDRFGRVDALVNNAGMLEPIVPIAKMNPHAWQYNIEVNLFGPFYLIQACMKELRIRHGRVINVSSGAAQKPIQAWSAYCVAKAGLTHLTAVLAAEEPDITAIALRPGVVDTEMQELIRLEGPGIMDDEKATYFRNLKEENKLEPPAVPARSIAWLALNAPSSWSGSFLNYDDPQIITPAISVFGTSI